MRGSRMGAASLLLTLPLAATAQDVHVLMPVDSIEMRLGHGTFEVLDNRGSRFTGDRTSRVALSFEDGTMLAAKWAPAGPGGEEFNNSPRLELAAYEVQKLFLDEPEYVVPPTVVRAFPVAWHEEHLGPVRPTFRGTSSTLVALQYWLLNVTPDGIWDEDRLESDSAYARHFGNFNILTYLIRHNDSNEGNYLISSDASNPRVFSVDNGLSFGSAISDRGARYRTLRTRRLPAHTVERLRALTRPDVTNRLETLVEFSIDSDGVLHPVAPTANMSRNRGIRRDDDRIQLGLTAREINDFWRRLESLLRDVDRGRIEVF